MAIITVIEARGKRYECPSDNLKTIRQLKGYLHKTHSIPFDIMHIKYLPINLLDTLHETGFTPVPLESITLNGPPTHTISDNIDSLVPDTWKEKNDISEVSIEKEENNQLANVILADDVIIKAGDIFYMELDMSGQCAGCYCHIGEPWPACRTSCCYMGCDGNWRHCQYCCLYCGCGGCAIM